MKILYGIQGTGNGHLSRGEFIYNLLKRYSNNIDVLISGDNYSLQPSMPVRYKNKGVTFSIKNGKIDYLKTLMNFDLVTSYLEQKEIPFKKYDLIITDFEPVTAWASVRYKIPSIHISHQAAFINSNVPRPAFKNMVGEYVMRYFCPTGDYIGLHYKRYGDQISEPIISKDIQLCVTELKDHVAVYLPWYEDEYLCSFFKQFKGLSFHIFSKNTKKLNKIDNTILFPISKSNFLNSVRTSLGVISNAGFQTSSEVIYLGKRLLVIPVKGQYEQVCNVAALKEIGIQSLETLNNNAIDKIKTWLNSEPIEIKFQNNVADLLDKKIIKN